MNKRGIQAEAGDALNRMCALFKDRCATTVELADWVAMYFADVSPSEADLATYVTDAVGQALLTLSDELQALPPPQWDRVGIAAVIKKTLAAHGLKMGQLAPAVRVLVCGRAQTPSVDAVLELFNCQIIAMRLRRP